MTNLYENIQMGKLAKLETAGKVLETLKQGILAEGKVTDSYMEAFINAIVHATDHGNHSLVNQCFTQLSSRSMYKPKIKKWIEEYTPLKWSKTKDGFIRKTLDGKKKVEWTTDHVNNLIANPFYQTKEVSEKPAFGMKEYFHNINKINNLTKLTLSKLKESDFYKEYENNLKEAEALQDDSDKELAIALIKDSMPINIEGITASLKFIEVELSKKPENF